MKHAWYALCQPGRAVRAGCCRLHRSRSAGDHTVAEHGVLVIGTHGGNRPARGEHGPARVADTTSRVGAVLRLDRRR